MGFNLATTSTSTRKKVVQRLLNLTERLGSAHIKAERVHRGVDGWVGVGFLAGKKGPLPSYNLEEAKLVVMG